MYIVDMHNYVKQGLHRINSQIFRGYQSEQIDLVLNRAQDVVFEEEYSWLTDKEGVERSRRNIGNISNITVNNYNTTCILAYDGTTPEYSIDGVPAKFKATLPPDCYYVQSVRPKIYYNPCGSITIGSYVSKGMAVSVIPFVTNPDTLGADLFTGVLLSLDGTIPVINVQRVIGYPAWTLYRFPEDGPGLAIHLTKAMDIRAQAHYFRAIYEGYKGLYYPGCILILKDIQDDPTATPTLPGSALAASMTLTGIAYVHTENYTTFSYYPIPTLSNGSEKYARGVIRRHQESEDILSNAFHKPNYDDIPVWVAEKHLNMYSDGTFMIQSAQISYIRRPRPMSLLLNQGCELSESLHRKICDNAITYLLAITSRQNYQQAVMEDEKVK